jgi:hypothetical protein
MDNLREGSLLPSLLTLFLAYQKTGKYSLCTIGKGWGKVHSTRAFSTPPVFHSSIAARLLRYRSGATRPAQEYDPEQRPKTQTEFMKLKLGLTPDQPRKVTHTVVKWVKRPKVEFIGDR